ncbi:MAG: methyltransferase, TIGR04325 family [Phycisphaeraceae bacterium]|nr:methyltransferase, TIGR04325 family [Phycisphaeraceae bacterium]
MSTSLRRIAKAWLPPAVTGGLLRMRHGPGITFTGPYASWSEACASASGYDAANILERVLETSRRVRSGEVAFERDSVAFDQVIHSFPLLAGLLRAAAGNGNRLAVLDFGGSLGSSYRQCRRFLDGLSELRWTVVEQPHYVECGQKHFSSGELSFRRTIAEAIADRPPTVALISGVIQFLPEPFAVLDELLGCGASTVIIDRTPFAEIREDLIAVQHIPPAIFKASYASWIFARAPFLDRVRGRFEILAEFDSAADGRAWLGAQEFVYGGLILQRR